MICPKGLIISPVRGFDVFRHDLSLVPHLNENLVEGVPSLSPWKR